MKNIKEFLKIIVGYLIEFIEKIEYRWYDFDENDPSKKIICDYKLDDINVLSDKGYVKASTLFLTQPYHVYRIELEDGTHIECADNHIMYTLNMSQVFAKDLMVGDFLFCDNYRYKKIIKIKRYGYKMCMYDLSVNSDDHRYFTNGILSHNTTTISSFVAWMLVFHVDKNVLIVANKEKTSIEIVDKIINIFKGLPYFLKPGAEQFGKTALKLDNGSRIVSSATTSSASIGFTIHLLLLDEFAHVPANIVNSFWRSVYPTLSSSKVSQCIITSTPNGVQNKFYDIWSGSIEGRNSFVNIKTDYWRVPGHDEEWAAQQRANLGEEEFAQEFELQFNRNSKMLLSADSMSFIERLEKQYVRKDIKNANSYLDTMFITWHPDFNPNNIKESDRFVFLVDLAEGNGDSKDLFNKDRKTPDSNTINIFRLRVNSVANLRKYSGISCSLKDCVRFEQVGKFVCNCEDEVYTARVCSALAYNVFRDNERNNVRVMVEMNFNGKAFFEEFRRHQCFCGSTILKTYHRKPVPGEHLKKKFGFKTTSNKEYYCLKGNKMIQMHRIIINCHDTFEQMKSFGFVRNKLGGVGVHDDLAMPVFNHIPRMLDEKSFVCWIDEWMFTMKYPERAKVVKLNKVIKQWAIDNPEMSDDDFMALYGLDARYLSPPTLNDFKEYDTEVPQYGWMQNPYSQNSAFSQNPFSQGNETTYSNLINPNGGGYNGW